MTAKDLLYKILDYRYLWMLPKNSNSKPAKLRLEQIEALLDAFGLSKKYVNPLVQAKYSIGGSKNSLDRADYLNGLSNIEYLLWGEFIKDRPYELNEELTSKAFSIVTGIYTDLPESITERPVDISWMFNHLLNFRQEIFKVTYPNGGMLEGFSIGLHYSFYLQRNLKKAIMDSLAEIDETLWLILDPAKRDIEINDLVSKYKYADHDLKAIDLDWSMEDY